MRLRNIKGSREAIAASVYTINEERKDGDSFENRSSWPVKGNWSQVFGNDHPLHIEIGMGKGAFLMEMARNHPGINYVGIEKYSSVLLRAVQKQESEQLPNVRLIRMEAENINDVFAPDEVERIYLNFSDPWPKAAHAGRRLTSRQFMARYDTILKDGGTIEFKTDNQELFDFSVDEIRQLQLEYEMKLENCRINPDSEINIAGNCTSMDDTHQENRSEPQQLKAEKPETRDVPRQVWVITAMTRDLHHDPVLSLGNVMTEYERRWSSEGKNICALHLFHGFNK